MPFKQVVAAFMVILSVAACAETNDQPKRLFGGLAGAALGGLLGAQFGSGTGRLMTTSAGVLIGALVGSEVGKSLDNVDQMKANQAVNQAHVTPLGDTITWNNPGSGNSGSVTPLRDGQSNSGQYYREFQQTITVDGNTERGFGIACRQADGTWRIVSN